MENLPIEVRRMIYEKVDHQSLLKLRLVKSTIKDEVDDYPGFNIWIETNQMSQETFMNLLNIKAHSVRLINKKSLQDNVTDPSLGWDFSPTYPSHVRTLQLGDKCLQEDMGYVQEQLFYKVLHECPQIENVIITGVHFYGEPLEASKKSSMDSSDLDPQPIIKSMQNLRNLRVTVDRVSDDVVKPNTRTLQVLHSLFSDLTSPALTSMYFHVYWEDSSFGSDPALQIQSLLPNPWSTIFQLVSRHWETLRELHFDLNWHEKWGTGLQSWDEILEDWDWIVTDQEFSENFKRIHSLTKFSLLNDIQSRNPQLQQLLANFIKQQKCLKEAKMQTNILTVDILKQVLESNANTLRVLKVGIQEDSGWGTTINDTPIDMSLFSNCKELEHMRLVDDVAFYSHSHDQRRRRIINLGSVPSQVQRLTLRGFSFPNCMRQLRALSFNCSNLRRLKLDLTKLTNILGLASVMANFVQTSEELQEVSFKIRKQEDHLGFDDYEEEWDVEVYSLRTLFEWFYETDIVWKDNAKTYDFFIYDITPADRNRVNGLELDPEDDSEDDSEDDLEDELEEDMEDELEDDHDDDLENFEDDLEDA